MKHHIAMVVLAGSLVGISQGQTIWAVNNLNGTSTPTNINTIETFNPATPATRTVIGQTTPGASILFGGLEFAGVGGGLFAWSTIAPFAGLSSINQTTGAATLIGPNTLAGVNDLSWNPVTNQMIALVNASTAAPAELHSVNLSTGATTFLGTVNGITGGLSVGLAHDAAGNAYVHDLVGDRVHRLDATFTSVASAVLPGNTNFSQGMTIDWSGSGVGYMAAIGNAAGGGFFSELWTLNTATMTVSVVGTFGTAPPTFPTFEGGDLAIKPVPEPATMMALGLGALALLRRRR